MENLVTVTGTVAVKNPGRKNNNDDIGDGDQGGNATGSIPPVSGRLRVLTLEMSCKENDGEIIKILCYDDWEPHFRNVRVGDKISLTVSRELVRFKNDREHVACVTLILDQSHGTRYYISVSITLVYIRLKIPVISVIKEFV